VDESSAKKLRAPFPENQIGKLPKLTCRNCRDSRFKACDNHTKRTCQVCGNWISPAHTHLDYVGHADITGRFLEVDPEWDWEPVAREVDQQLLLAAVQTGNPDIVNAVLNSAPPKLDSNGGMWMRVTIAGVTRLGYGDGGGKHGPDAVKVAIGDGLRNAGMRFGAGLDMWRKDTEPADTDTSPTSKPPQQQHTNKAWLAGMKKRIAAAGSEQELLTLANEIEAKVSGGFCEQSDYEQLCAQGNARLQEVRQAEPAPAPQPPAPADGPNEQQPTEPDGAAAGFQKRLEAAGDLDVLLALKEDVMAAFKDQRLNPTEGNALLRAIKTKQQDVGTGAL
jgi:hypothetical protein